MHVVNVSDLAGNNLPNLVRGTIVQDKVPPGPEPLPPQLQEGQKLAVGLGHAFLGPEEAKRGLWWRLGRLGVVRDEARRGVGDLVAPIRSQGGHDSQAGEGKVGQRGGDHPRKVQRVSKAVSERWILLEATGRARDRGGPSLQDFQGMEPQPERGHPIHPFQVGNHPHAHGLPIAAVQVLEPHVHAIVVRLESMRLCNLRRGRPLHPHRPCPHPVHRTQ
mmetsp:Transcript_2975/g.8052  ORF Transcript_2975/g.8052 Transcript_2975/m.8052 type:complete len:219 (-) Transcript_2975:122-778(-)